MATRSPNPHSSRALPGAAMALALALGSVLAGCNNAGEGAITGAALGALGGLAIGSVTGGSGTGAVIGAVGGAAVGAVIGDQNERNSYREHRASGYRTYEYD